MARHEADGTYVLPVRDEVLVVERRLVPREEHVHVERRPANSPGIAGEDLFRERVIEAEETSEEVVVAKEARVTGEVVVNKETTERTEDGPAGLTDPCSPLPGVPS